MQIKSIFSDGHLCFFAQSPCLLPAFLKSRPSHQIDFLSWAGFIYVASLCNHAQNRKGGRTAT